MQSKIRLVGVLGAALVLGACFDEPEDNRGSLDFSGGGAALNRAPTIAGTPTSNVLEGEFFEFQPNAADPDGDTLEFSIARKPSWAQFDRRSGRLWGTPGAGDVGSFTNIRISVSDTQATAALAAFDVSVNQIAAGTATLSWEPPTENADGTPLTDLAGYRIYYGRNQANLSQVVIVNNPGLSRYVIENLTPARWHFEMTSVNTEGAESPRTATSSKSIG